MVNPLHYIIVGAKSPAGRNAIRGLVERGIEPSYVTAIDIKQGSMSYGDTATLAIQSPDAYKVLTQRKTAQMVLADTRAEFIDVADRHLDDGGRLLDLTGHFITDPDAVMAPADGLLVIQPSCAATMVHSVVSALPARPDTLHLTVFLPASHFGKDGMDELFQQVRQFLVSEELDNSVFPKKLAFNVLPYAGSLDDDGISSEETRLYAELKYLLPTIDVAITAVVVPVFIGVSIQVAAYFKDGKAPTTREAGLAWHRNRMLRVIDPQSDLIAASPAEIAGDDMISISRVHTPPNLANSLSFWLTADNTLA